MVKVLPLTVVGVIAPRVKVIAGVVVAVATDPETPLAVVTETLVTLPAPAVLGVLSALHEAAVVPLVKIQVTIAVDEADSTVILLAPEDWMVTAPVLLLTIWNC